MDNGQHRKGRMGRAFRKTAGRYKSKDERGPQEWEEKAGREREGRGEGGESG